MKTIIGLYVVFAVAGCGLPMEKDPYVGGDSTTVVNVTNTTAPCPTCPTPCPTGNCPTCPKLPEDPCANVACTNGQVCQGGQCMCPENQVWDDTRKKCVGQTGESCVKGENDSLLCEGGDVCCPDVLGAKVCVPIDDACTWVCSTISSLLIDDGRSASCTTPPVQTCSWVCNNGCTQ